MSKLSKSDVALLHARHAYNNAEILEIAQLLESWLSIKT